MRIVIRSIMFLWVLTILSIIVSLSFARIFPAPMIEWSTLSGFLMDSRTGINYPLEFLGRAEIRLSSNRMSPDGQYHLVSTRGETGTSVSILDSDRQLVYSFAGDMENPISTLNWIDGTNLLYTRVDSLSNHLEIRRVDIEAGEHHSVGIYSGGNFIFSPQNLWLITGGIDASGTTIYHTMGPVEYSLPPIVSALFWSDDERYLAYLTSIDDESRLYLLDMQTGEHGTYNLMPEQVGFAVANTRIFVQTASGIALIEDMQLIAEIEIPHHLVRIEWFASGEQLLVLTEDDGDIHMYLLELQDDRSLRFLMTVPADIDMDTVHVAISGDAISYLRNTDDRVETAVYRVSLANGNTRLMSRIPAHFRQIRLFEDFESFQNFGQ